MSSRSAFTVTATARCGVGGLGAAVNTMSSSCVALLALALGAAGCDGFADPSREYGAPVAGEATHGTLIESPQTLGVVDSPLVDVNGTPIGVECETCHGPNPATSWAATPGKPFHTGVGVTEGGVRFLHKHGHLRCDNCHTEDRLTVHLADGTHLSLGDTMRLCAQCHGPQSRDYQHGSHGGMDGFWDLRQGPRTRNNCVVCHAPHAPHFEPRLPAKGPQDWYLRPKPEFTEEGEAPDSEAAEPTPAAPVTDPAPEEATHG